jgi:hypothetical protein
MLGQSNIFSDILPALRGKDRWWDRVENRAGNEGMKEGK